MNQSSLTAKSTAAMKTISEVASILDLPTHVLRFWETKFPQIQPLKRGGGRRFYRPEDIDALLLIKELLHQRNYTIRGAAKVLPELLKNRHRPAIEPSVPAVAPSITHLDTIEGISPSEDTRLTPSRRQALLALKRELEAIRAMLAA